MDTLAIRHGTSYFSAISARNALITMVVTAICICATTLVGKRASDVGTDTFRYAQTFLALKRGQSTTGFEPGFAWFARATGWLGFGVKEYQAALYVLLLATVLLSTRKYFRYLGCERGYLTFFTASLMLLFVSPAFANASINGIRQGLAALVVFTALMCFHRRQWLNFSLYAALAVSFHYSSLLYIIFAPTLLLRRQLLCIIVGLAFPIYCSGSSKILVKTFAPSIYAFVMHYGAYADYDAGVRLDFAVFSIFWFLVPYIVSRFAHFPYSERIKDSASVYLVMLLPFFAVGWGNYSNRYLFSAWLAIPLIIAAILFNGRVALFKHPLSLTFGLIIAFGVYTAYIRSASGA